MSNRSYQSGQIIKKEESNESKEPIEICAHKNLVPLEIHFARVSYPDGYNNSPHYDYTANIVSANIARVKKYYCLNCRKEVYGPKRNHMEG